MNSTVTNRMGDVIIALAEAEKAKVRPTKIQLQKFIYLTDILGQVIGLFRPREGHKTYRNGPYDAAIQNAVDSLAFRALVQITGVWKTPSGYLATRYELAAPGRKLLEKLRSSDALKRRIWIGEMVGLELKKLGWDRIVGLVYAEPTFVARRSSGWGTELTAEDGLSISTAFVLAIMRRVTALLNPEGTVSPEWFTERFFAYLDDYDANYGLKQEATG